MDSKSATNEASAPQTFDRMAKFFAGRTAQRCCSYFLQDVKPTDRILDVGCRPGSISIGLAELVPQGQVTAIDIFTDDFDQARAAAASRNVSNITFAEGNAQSLLQQFEEESFDIVHAHMVMMYMNDPVGVLRAMKRLLKPRGYVAYKDSAIALFNPYPPGLQRHRQMFETITKSRNQHSDAGRYNPGWAHEAGFGWDQIKFGSDAWETNGEQGRRVLSQSAKNSLREAALSHGLATVEELDEIRAAWERWAEDEAARFIEVSGWVLCRN